MTQNKLIQNVYLTADIDKKISFVLHYLMRHNVLLVTLSCCEEREAQRKIRLCLNSLQQECDRRMLKITLAENDYTRLWTMYMHRSII